MPLSPAIIGVVVVSFLIACGKQDPTPALPKVDPTLAEHVPAAVLPGSHEDWCVEHEVPESLCTRCDPSLVAAFKATGDWCAEHGLPESQCKLCHPDLKIARPPKVSK